MVKYLSASVLLGISKALELDPSLIQDAGSNNLPRIVKEIAKIDAKNGQTQGKALQQDEMGWMNNYGCWCYFEDNVGKGRGRPKDRVDEICQTLQRGYECIMLDQEQANDPCIPWEINYSSSSGLAGVHPLEDDLANLNHECNQFNPDGCARKACKVEGWFLILYNRYTLDPNFNGILFDPNLRHSNGFVSNEQTCPKVTAGLGAAEDRCCGDYPERIPYRHKDGARECCNNNNIATVYNAALFDCCSDGSVAPSC